MLKRFSCGNDILGCTAGMDAMTMQVRCWTKPKKRPKVGQGFHDKAQKWRDEFLLDRHRVLADSLKGYMEFSSSKRTEPWDTRFRPFDRVEKDGVHLVAKFLMEDKLQLVGHHPRATKRLFCNVGLLGPQVSTVARWKPHRFAQLPATATKAERMYQKDRLNMHNYGFND